MTLHRADPRTSRANDPNDPANGPSWHTGKPCIEDGCDEPAGTAWSPYWCQRHNAERLDRITASLDAIDASLTERKSVSDRADPPC